MSENSPDDLVIITKDGEETTTVPRWALPSREANGWKISKAKPADPTTNGA